VTQQITLFFRLAPMNRSDIPDQRAFENTCPSILSRLVDGVTDWNCTVKQSKFLVLQASETLEFEVIIGGKPASLTSKDEFFNTVLQSLRESTELFLESLKSSTTDYASARSLTVSTTSASATPGPVIAEPDTSEEIGAGIVAAIVIGAVLAVLFIGAGVMVLSKNARRQHPEPRETPEAPAVTSKPIAIPPPRLIPRPTETPRTETPRTETPRTAAPPTVPVVSVDRKESVDSSGSGESVSDSQGNTFPNTGNSTIAGESEMDAFSVAPGNVEPGRSVAEPVANNDTSASGDELSSHAMSSLRQTMISRTIVAPPGKLGIVIDTTLEGPIVHKINPQSPLEGSLFPGDIIVAIDDVDTRAMSASAITALMVRTANLRRTLTVLSEDMNT
jgi:hypothetical protein